MDFAAIALAPPIPGCEGQATGKEDRLIPGPVGRMETLAQILQRASLRRQIKGLGRKWECWTADDEEFELGGCVEGTEERSGMGLGAKEEDGRRRAARKEDGGR